MIQMVDEGGRYIDIILLGVTSVVPHVGRFSDLLRRGEGGGGCVQIVHWGWGLIWWSTVQEWG